MEEMNQKRPAAPKRTRQNGEGGRRPRHTAGNAPAGGPKNIFFQRINIFS